MGKEHKRQSIRYQFLGVCLSRKCGRSYLHRASPLHLEQSSAPHHITDIPKMSFLFAHSHTFSHSTVFELHPHHELFTFHSTKYFIAGYLIDILDDLAQVPFCLDHVKFFSGHWLSAISALTLLVGRQEGHPACKKHGGWRRWALVSPDGVAPSRMVSVSDSVNLPLHHKVQKFSSGTGSPMWSRKKGWCVVIICSQPECTRWYLDIAWMYKVVPWHRCPICHRSRKAGRDETVRRCWPCRKPAPYQARHQRGSTASHQPQG